MWDGLGRFFKVVPVDRTKKPLAGWVDGVSHGLLSQL